MSEASGLEPEREVWRPVVGYEGRYSVSSKGRVRSEPKDVIRRNGNYRTAQRVMRPAKGINQKYLSLRLTDAHGNQRTHYIHVMVLEAFVSARPLQMDACHCDGNSVNNAARNLRWDTRSANHRDKNDHGTATIGERHPMAILDDRTVLEMRKRRSEGASATVLAREFNVSRMTAFRAATGRSWSHLP